jgi:MFS family permease
MDVTVDERARHLRRAVIASAVGTAIEWYDFFLYGVAAALVFPATFFPATDPYTATLLSFSTYFIGFASRPIGAAIFGHFGDRLGRKASLIATLLLMGVATAGIGLVPGYDSIGVWGAVFLTIGRVLQGIAVGGEWGGSVLLAAEWAGKGQRGFAASWPQWGAPVGLLLSYGAVRLTTYATGADFGSWGWRLPFLASFALVAIGFWIRVGIEEPPTFRRMKAERTLARAPVVEVLRHNWREVLLTALLRTGQQAPFYVFTVYVLTYGTQTLHHDRSFLLNGVLVAAAVSMIAIPFWGRLSDRISRRRLVGVGAAIMVVFPFAYFGLLDTGSTALALVAIILAQPIHDIQYAPQAAVIAESFPARLRYSGSSLGYQLASITAGGPAPLIATWIDHELHSSMAIAAYLSACAVISLIALALLRDHQGRDMESET